MKTEYLEPLVLQTVAPEWYHTFTLDEYHRLTNDGYFVADERVELLEGFLVSQPVQTPLHAATVNMLMKAAHALVGLDWHTRIRSGVSLEVSEPEPDISVVRGAEEAYVARHPGPADIGLLIEVSDTSLVRDRVDKLRIYARAGVPTYWIVNLVDRQVEVHDRPTGPAANPEYASRATYVTGDTVPVVLGGQAVGQIAVSAVLPAA